MLAFALALTLTALAPTSHLSNGVPFDSVLEEHANRGEEVDTQEFTPPAPGVRAGVSASAFFLSSTEWTLRLRLRSWGRGTDQNDVAPGLLTDDTDTSRIVRPGLTEWFVERAEGLEHGFTIHERPDNVDGEQVRLILATEGGFASRVLPGARDVRIRGPVSVLYSGLAAWDSDGRALSAHFCEEEGGLAILVDDRDATYPLTVDPWIAVETKITAPVVLAGDSFGEAVAIDGDTMLVGAEYGSTILGAPTGEVHVYERATGTWQHQTTLLSHNPGVYKSFGDAVALSGDTAVVGDRRNAGIVGAASVFVRHGTAWSREAVLLGSDSVAGDQFGQSVAVHGDTVVVGARTNGTWGAQTGSAYVFVRDGTTWTEQAKLTASDQGKYDNFGAAVAIEGDMILIGAPGEDYPLPGSGQDRGAAYVFVRTGTAWTQQAKLLAGDAGGHDEAGWAVALSGNTAVVGAPQRWNYWEQAAGTAFVFVIDSSTWTHQATLVGAGWEYDQFGHTVDIDGDFAVVGSPSDGYVRSGEAYIYHREGTHWSYILRLLPQLPTVGDKNGAAVSIQGHTVLVGAPGDDDLGANSGSLYDYQVGQFADAECVKYCGTGINRDIYEMWHVFELGRYFKGSVVLSPPSVGAVFAGYLGQSIFPIWGQEGLVDMATPEVFGLPFVAGPSPAQYWESLPHEQAWAGIHVYTQAAAVGGGTILLTCAHDCTVGY